VARLVKFVKARNPLAHGAEKNWPARRSRFRLPLVISDLEVRLRYWVNFFSATRAGGSDWREHSSSRFFVDGPPGWPAIRFLVSAALVLFACPAVLTAATQSDRVPESDSGRTLAVVAGISRYSNAGVPQLQFADRDAQAFYDFLLTRRGGVLPQNAKLLLNGDATLDAIRGAIRSMFDRAKPNDTVVLFIAGHGMAMEEKPNRGAFILAVHSNPENLAASALRMDELQELTSGPFRPRRVRVFIDACHSGVIGSIQNLKFNRFAINVLDDKLPIVYGLMASGYKQLSYECANFGHGAFTYYLLRGLNTNEAADEHLGDVTADSLFDFLYTHVRLATAKKQTPVNSSHVSDRLQIADLKLPGVDSQQLKQAADSCVDARGRELQTQPVSSSEAQPSDAFSEALRQGSILPGTPGSAFELLEQQRGKPEYEFNRDRLTVALEDAGQHVILDYLKGEQVPQRREQFEAGEQFFAAAATLAPMDKFVESRRLFCKGRKLIFDHKYDDAIATLERSLQLFPGGAYANNAIGIAYLESANFDRAIGTFREAVRLAPYWVYARHNLALALTQGGEYARALETYEQAALLVPHYSYVRYNQGLLLQRLNRSKDARDAWQQALALAPAMSRAWIAIGLSYYLDGRYSAAAKNYDKAAALVTEQTDRLILRHDMALLRVVQDRISEAIMLWRANLAERPDDLSSLIGLSDALQKQGDTQGALAALAEVVREHPDLVGARLKYARILFELGKFREAAEQLRSVTESKVADSEAYELLADAKKALGPEEAEQTRLLYEQSLRLAVTRKQRERIKGKLRTLARP